jgi:hypothetical protein
VEAGTLQTKAKKREQHARRQTRQRGREKKRKTNAADNLSATRVERVLPTWAAILAMDADKVREIGLKTRHAGAINRRLG